MCIYITLRRDLRRANVISRQRVDISIQIIRKLKERIDIRFQITSKNRRMYSNYSAQRLAQSKRNLETKSRHIYSNY